MSLRLYDTRRGEKVPFAPIGDGPIGLYVCGVTPYDTGHLGHAFIEGYAHTLVGSAVMSMSRLLGPGRTLARLTRSLRTANNYSEARLTAHAPNRYALWVNEPSDTEGFMEGVLHAGLRMAGAREPLVQRARSGPAACEYSLSWALAEAA